MNTYIQNKLDELIETYRKENYSEYDVRMVAERLATDYHNHIVEKIESKKYKSEKDKLGFDPINSPIFRLEKLINEKLDEVITTLQDTNTKE